MKCDFIFLRLLAIFCIGVSVNNLHADWNAEECLVDVEESSFAVLQNSGFKSLKESVKKALAGSWCSVEKINLMMDLIAVTRPDVCVEIGAFTGSSVLPVAATLRHFNHGRIFAIDAWSNEEMIRNLADNDPNKGWWSKVSMKGVRNQFDQMVKSWNLGSLCTTIQDTSENAVNRLPEIDFLHLDGDYSEIGSFRDVQLYLPKVKSGGYILLSNLFIMVNGKQPKLKAFCSLFDSCEMICEIERDNVVLFKKQ